MQMETVIGLEVHAQLKTRTKIFCSCSTQFGARPNTHTCSVCLGMPGSLPVLNKKVVEFSLRMAMATQSEIQLTSQFARKNYFYPDLPKGYQISQFELPLARNGHLQIGTRRIRINRIHLEEDAGKLIHDPDLPISKVDLNRTGVPLIEIVSEPDLRSPQEAGIYLRKLRSIVKYLEICDGNLEEGSFRCDANISIRAQGSETLGTRTEVKNLNSFKAVEKALFYEIERQQDLIFEGQSVLQETRLWDPQKNRTLSMRSKEEAHDYRYFPDPDLVPLVLEQGWLTQIKASLPELPDARKNRLIEQYQLKPDHAEVLTASRAMADYFEECVKIFPESKQAANWIMGDLTAILNSQNKHIDKSPVSPEYLAHLLRLVTQGVISGKIAKTVLEEMSRTNKTAEQIVTEKGLRQENNLDSLDQIIAGVLTEYPEEIAKYKQGKRKLMGFFVGQVMKVTKGKANPKIVNQILQKRLET